MFAAITESLRGSEETARLNENGNASEGNGNASSETDRPSYGTSAPPETPGGNNSSALPDTPGGANSLNPEASGAMEGDANGPYSDEIEDVVTSLTRRVRCLFSIITYPIVPLGTIASLALGWLIYASFVLDVNKSCSHPLHWFAVLSLILVLYAPYHGRIRSYLFQYTRERGTERPPSVRRYDQLFHTLALVYVYAGIVLLQTCRDDLSVLTPDDGASSGDLDLTEPINTCAATCPNLFAALRVYVLTIEIFTFSLILPLLFLPCLYLYFIRRTMQDAESLATLQERLREEEALMRNGGVTTQQIMDQFEKVELVVDPHSTERRVLMVKDNEGLEDSPECSSKECCICMEAFAVQEDEEAGQETPSFDNQVIRTKTCGHMFHRRCIASWVGGRWQANGSEDSNSGNDNSNEREASRRARRTTCPLCRQDVRSNRG
mmetsp:Transcript_34335/g.71493  ORF Transcript_34335/g.71493 Transcript_34335/m.71493 type:complete len:436 (+) Transcript_34335:183-1490(+)